MTKFIVRIALVTVLFMSARHAAAELTFVSRTSSISVTSNFQPLSEPPSVTTDSDGLTGPGLYDSSVSTGVSSVANASQTSQASQSGASVTLLADAPLQGTEFGFNRAESTFEYVFGIASPVSYSLSGMIDVDPTGDFDPSAEFGEVSLSGPGVNDLFRQDESNATGSAQPFDFSGTLSPGTYTLSMMAYAGDSPAANAGSTVSVNGTLVAIPEPSTAVLAVIGLLLFCHRLGLIHS